jgi:crossover junction endodeoxyribonuclease RusA
MSEEETEPPYFCCRLVELQGAGGRRTGARVTIVAPCAWIRSNQHKDAYWTRAKLTQQWRAATALAARAQHLPALGAGPFHITATIHRDDKRAYDLDGVAPTVKAAIDGLRDAGVLADDNCRVVPLLTLRAGEQWADASLVLTIEPTPRSSDE